MSIGQHTRVGRLKIRVDRLVYTTITLVSVLIIYDGWNHLGFWGVLAVIVGPMLAIFLSHLFGAELGTRVALGRPLTWRERRVAFVEECRFLVLLVPPVLIPSTSITFQAQPLMPVPEPIVMVMTEAAFGDALR